MGHPHDCFSDIFKVKIQKSAPTTFVATHKEYDMWCILSLTKKSSTPPSTNNEQYFYPSERAVAAVAVAVVAVVAGEK
jgi:hypothetical protein